MLVKSGSAVKRNLAPFIRSFAPDDLVADPSSYMSMLIHSMLRGFGSNKVLEARSSTNVLQVLTNQKIDILICDSRLPPHGGLPLTRAIRRKQDNANRTIPILVMTSDGSLSGSVSGKRGTANLFSGWVSESKFSFTINVPVQDSPADVTFSGTFDGTSLKGNISVLGFSIDFTGVKPTQQAATETTAAAGDLR